MDIRKFIPMLKADSIVGAIIDTDTILAGDIAAGAVGTSELADGALSADAAGRLKIADSFFDLATHALKVAAGAVATAALADGILSAAVAGRAKMAANFFDAATVLDKFAANSFDAANVADAFATNSIDVANFADIVQDLAVITAKLANNAVTSAKTETDLIQYVDVQLTNAQVLALRAVPVQVIAAPAANRTVIVHRIQVVSDSAAGAWTEPDVNNIALEYATGLDIILIEATAFVTTGSVQARTYAPAVTEFTPPAASAVRLFQVGAAEFGGGNAANTLSIRVWYSLADTIAFA